jgi:hypothetical protein
MSKYLVIADIHQKHVRAQNLIESVPHDKCVLLGDYFDNFGDLTEEARNTAIWLRDSVLPNPKIIPLTGNHDLPYFYPACPYIRCSGFTGFKCLAVNEVLLPEHVAKFKVFHTEGNFLFSHAGFSNLLWKDVSLKHAKGENESKFDFVVRVLAECANEGVREIAVGHDYWLFGAGWDRGGIQRHGGINWVDWTNFAPISGINQLVGHTPHKIPEILIQRSGGGYTKRDVIKQENYPPVPPNEILSINYALDTHLNHYAVIEDGKVNIFDYQNRINVKDLKNYFIPENRMSPLC